MQTIVAERGKRTYPTRKPAANLTGLKRQEVAQITKAFDRRDREGPLGGREESHASELLFAFSLFFSLRALRSRAYS